MFRRQGYSQTSMLDIAREAGIASGTVYQYFSDKPDLFAALLETLVDLLHRKTRMPADPDGRLIVRESVLHYLEVYREHDAVFRVWWELMEPPTQFTQAWVDVHQKSRRELAAVVQDGQRRGIVDGDLDADISADLIVAMFEKPAYARIVLGWDEDTTDEEMAETMARILGTGLRS